MAPTGTPLGNTFMVTDPVEQLCLLPPLDESSLELAGCTLLADSLIFLFSASKLLPESPKGCIGRQDIDLLHQC